MPFMYGPQPVRRTVKFLEQGRLIFLERVRIMSLNFNTMGLRREAHKGMEDFVFWDLPRIIYKNPEVQVTLFKNMTPSPFIRFWLDGGRQVIMDTDSKTNTEILNQIIKTLGKTEEKLAQEAFMREQKETQANFGRNFPKWCICEVESQVPCPRIVELPKKMRGKYIVQEIASKE
ncbi:probable 28S ribosomal protein S25, mitochondrial [Galendromus occidentalis]|uniref:Small ribosomal subunit protein mS25 n=1 Tax=Galendromus occidentalis TaxID=34638 RepID=A0AAJ7L5L9_9ACAR|nr:probable 28S ribosomal protein S25, mitochondrial [Galendromus occidentalis]